MNNQQEDPVSESIVNQETSNEKKEGDLSGNETGMNVEDALKNVENDHIQKLENEISSEKDKLLRLFAEFENYKKRTIRERADLMKTAGQEVIYALLPVMDDFERALRNVSETDSTEKEGLILIHQKLKTILEQRGLTAMDCIGKPFDTDLHEAITNVPAGDEMKEKVVDEAEKGYFLNGKVIRHAKVIVGN